MFKDIKSSLSGIFNKKTLPIIFLIIIVIGLYFYSNNRYDILDKMTTGETVVSPPTSPSDPVIESPTIIQNSMHDPSDLLPKDSNSQWASLNPISQGNVAIPDLLQSGYHIGLDTIGQTLKNPNYQLRSDPVIEKRDSGPWNQSTIEPDFGRIPLETGYGQR
jgi:hypothetical protein